MTASAPGTFGPRIMELAERLAQWSESPDRLTCTFLSPAHRSVAAELFRWMRQAGLHVEIDAIGNVVGRYAASVPQPRTLIIASHYDTVRHGGKYDGRLGVLTALVLAEHLQQLRRKLPFNLDVVAFSEEEGVRFSTSFLGSSALAGRFDAELLERRDADGKSLAAALREADLDPGKILQLARAPAELIGYLEVHIEQGPILHAKGIDVGVVTHGYTAHGFIVEVQGETAHSGPFTRPFRMTSSSARFAARLPCIFQLSATSRVRAMPMNFTALEFLLRRNNRTASVERQGAERHGAPQRFRHTRKLK